MELPMKVTDVRETTAAISDSSGKIQRDKPIDVRDGGKVRLGDYTPLFPAPRSK
jgi:hypothetical protein